MTSCMCAALAALLCATPALAWDAHGHRTITLLALDDFAAKLPEADRAGPLAFALGPSGRAQAGYQSGEPDRYRSIRLGQLRHENEPEHYIDIEDLEPFGLTLRTVPPLRYEYVRALVIAKHEHPDAMKPYNEKRDTARTQEFPGYLPHAVMEHYGKLVSGFRQVRVLETLHDPARADQLAAARSNVLFEMGQLSHLVGDAAQPLHTTTHHHGWVGDNPHGYTTNYGFHQYIDTTVLGIHALSYDTLKGETRPQRTCDRNDPWGDVLTHIERSFDQVRPLYELQKSGELVKAPGKAFIAERLGDGAAMLAAMYGAAWEASVATDQDVRDFVKYDQVSPAEPDPMKAREKPAEGAAPSPTVAPAPKP